MLQLARQHTTSLLSKAESGMGYQIVEVTMSDDTLKHGVAYNAEILLFDDDSRDMLASRFGSIKGFGALKYDDALQLLPSGHQVKMLRVITPAGAQQPVVSVKESSADYGKYTSGAVDAPCEKTKDGDAFRRFSAFQKDRRIRADGSVYPGTYATTAEDGDKVKTGLEAVERYALPNPMPASYRFAIQPHKDTIIKKGIAQPAYGHRGGGAEVIFVEGTQPKTVTVMKPLPDKLVP